MTLAVRAQADELMDADDLDPAIYADVVADLAKVNVVTMAARPTLAFLDRAVRGTRLRLLDVGYGDGDMLRRIARRAATRGIEAELVGIDLNARSGARGARAYPGGDADRLSHWRLCRSGARALGRDRQQPRRASHDRCAVDRVSALHGTARAHGLVRQRPAPPCVRASRLPAVGDDRPLASHRPPRRHAIDRAVVPARRMGADPGGGRDRRGARVPRLPRSGCASNG